MTRALMNGSNEPDPMRTIHNSHQALAILRAVQRQSGYRLNTNVLSDYLYELALGDTASDLRANLDILEKNGLIKLNQTEHAVVVELTQRGSEVALGRAIQEGVLRPDPACPY